MTTARRGPRPASDRLRRLLVMLPWLMERGEVTVVEVAERFGVSEKNLIADLERAAMCGLPPYVDEMIDLYIDDGVIHMGVPRLFTRPLRLTPREGFALLAAGRAALAVQGADPNGALARALVKLESALGERAVLSVRLEQPAFVEPIRQALAQRHMLDIDYYSPWRNERTSRRISPHAVFVDHGDWYVVADCSVAGEERRFRIDRIESLTLTAEKFERREVDLPVGAWSPDVGRVTLVTVRLAPTASWVVERHPVNEVRPGPNGTLDVDIFVSNERWLGRLLVRLGSDAVVLGPDDWKLLASRTAARMLRRYT